MSIMKDKLKIEDCYVNILRKNEESKYNIILLHGAKFKAKTWEDLGTINFLSKRGYNVVAIDMPGFGESPYCTMEQIEVLKRVIDKLKLDKPVILGPSMGGRITLNFYFTYPKIPKALILVGTVGVEENAPKIKGNGILVPTLIVWGEKDEIAPLKYANFLDQHIKNSKLVIMEDAPHPCYLKDPDKFHSIVDSFLMEVFNE